MASRGKPRDKWKYELRSEGGKLIRKGITGRPLKQREAELRREENAPRASIKQIGRKTTHDAARKWEDRQGKGTPPGGR